MVLTQSDEDLLEKIRVKPSIPSKSLQTRLPADKVQIAPASPAISRTSSTNLQSGNEWSEVPKLKLEPIKKTASLDPWAT